MYTGDDQPRPSAARLTRREFVGACGAAAAIVATPVWGAAISPPSGRPIPLDYFRRYVEIYPRNAWTGIPPQPQLMHRVGEFSRVTFHHAGTKVNTHTAPSQVVTDIEGILVGHQRRQWGDLGYHFVIDRAGRVWEGRCLHYQGAHVAGHNERNIGVMLLGNFERQHPSADQIDAMERMASALRRRCGIPASRVFGHRDLGPTLCPGAHLYRHVVALKS